MNIFRKLFPKWQPIYSTGDELQCLSKELEPCINKKTFIAEVIDRDQGMPNKYYKISTDDYQDHHKRPMIMYIHEMDILKKVPR